MRTAIQVIAISIILVAFSGCILLNDIAEGFNAVPYDGMYTTSYGAHIVTNNGVEVLCKTKSQFPIGFWGNLNVKFWNAYGDYRRTSTYKRYQEWTKLPSFQKEVIYWRGKKVDGKWVEIEETLRKKQ